MDRNSARKSDKPLPSRAKILKEDEEDEEGDGEEEEEMREMLRRKTPLSSSKSAPSLSLSKRMKKEEEEEEEDEYKAPSKRGEERGLGSGAKATPPLSSVRKLRKEEAEMEVESEKKRSVSVSVKREQTSRVETMNGGGKARVAVKGGVKKVEVGESVKEEERKKARSRASSKDKERDSSSSSKKDKKSFDLPGQKHNPLEERDPLRIFYESLHQQNPDSEMAEIWMMEYGLLGADEAERVLAKVKSKKAGVAGGVAAGGGGGARGGGRGGANTNSALAVRASAQPVGSGSSKGVKDGEASKRTPVPSPSPSRSSLSSSASAVRDSAVPLRSGGGNKRKKA